MATEEEVKQAADRVAALRQQIALQELQAREAGAEASRAATLKSLQEEEETLKARLGVQAPPTPAPPLPPRVVAQASPTNADPGRTQTFDTGEAK